MEKVVNNINQQSFKDFGYLIEYNPEKSEGFQVVLSEAGKEGWRIAVSKITRKQLLWLSKHPDSMESFEPISGVTLLCVAPAADPENFEIFLLDKPVCLFKNIWHATLCLSEYSLVKITENLEVSSENYKLDHEYEIKLARK